MSTKRKLATIAKPVQRGAKKPSATRIDESRTAVSAPDQSRPSLSKQTEPIEISSDSESNYDDLSDLDDHEDDENKTAQQSESGEKTRSQQNGGDADTEMKEGEPDQDDAHDAEPTFGDLIRDHHEAVDVAAAIHGANPQQTSTALTSVPPHQISAPSATSLGTVLAQALRTDDADLLESCLQISDATVIRNTIQRLDSRLASALLTQLASRLHRRPGRAHNLMSFVQWTLIAHGGALATQPEIQRRLAELNRVLEERSRGLNSLLALKGKLDMLEAQMTLRRGNKTRGVVDEDTSDEDEGEEGIVYVEGQEDEALSKGLPRRKDDDDDDLPVTNGVASDSEEDSDDEDQDDMDVEEFAEESLDEDEVDHDDIEENSGEEDESEAEAAPPAKVQKKSKSSFSKR